MINNYLQELQKEFCAAQEGAKRKIKANIKVPGSRSDLKGQEMDKEKPEGLSPALLENMSQSYKHVPGT